MKVLLQNSKTNLYLGRDAGWISDYESARVFSSTLDALNHCQISALRDVHIKLKFEKSEFDLVLNCCIEKGKGEGASELASG